MPAQEFDREKSLYLVLSISLHIILLLALIHLHWDKPTKNEPVEAEELPEIMPFQQDVAALKPRASQFGAPVIFQEEPTFTPKNTDHTADSPVSEPENSYDESSQEEQSQAQQQLQQEQTVTRPKHQEIKPQPKEEHPHTFVAQIEPEAPLKAQPEKQPQTQNEQSKELNATSMQSLLKHQDEQSKPDQDTQQQNIAKTTPQTQQIPVSTQPKKQQALRTRHQSGTQAEDAAPITKQLTFADLASGFIQTIKNEGQDLLEREGNENIRPDLEEMKLISYKQKVVWFIQNEFRIRSQEEPPHPEAIVKCPTLMMLDEDGKIISLQLVYSTDVPAFDRYYLDVLKSAAPYPPVPQHIKKPFVFPFTMIYYTRPKQTTSSGHRQPRVGFAFR